MQPVKTQLGPGGRVVIPAQYRKSLGLRPGDEVVLVLDEHEIRLVTPREAIKQAQSLVRQYVPKTRGLADELIRDRRREARRETSSRPRGRRRK